MKQLSHPIWSGTAVGLVLFCFFFLVIVMHERALNRDTLWLPQDDHRCVELGLRPDGFVVWKDCGVKR
jgi:hypothetical protein